MGKSEVDLEDDVAEIHEHAEAIAAAATRREKRRKDSTQPLGVQQRDPKETTADSGVTDGGDQNDGVGLSSTTTPDLEVLDGKRNVASKAAKSRTHRPRGKSTHRTPSTDERVAVEDDPWVTDSIKVRHSKKRRLKELSLRRELALESPYQKKDLVDEAFDYIFAKYEKR